MNIEKIKKYIQNLSIPNIQKTIKSVPISLKNNQNKLIGLLFILLILWVILYFIPTLILTIFDTLIGTIILLIIGLLIGFTDIKYGILFLVIVVIIKRFIYLSHTSIMTLNTKEGFTQINEETLNAFIQLQKTINPNIVFDTKELQKQVSQEEIDFFLKNGLWPWNNEVQKMYKEALSKNPYIRNDLDDSMNKARTIYNQYVILQILSWQEKEGLFLQNGILIKDINNIKTDNIYFGAGTYGINSGLISDKYKNKNKLIKCQPNPKKNNESQLALFKMNDDGLNQENKTNPTFLDTNKLEKIIPNFKFINKQCNPCVALNAIPNYECPFELNVKNKPFGISNVWQYLWNINVNPLQSLPK